MPRISNPTDGLGSAMVGDGMGFHGIVFVTIWFRSLRHGQLQPERV
jgi:hypothetical protein